MEALKDPDRQHLLDARLANFVSGTRQMEASEIIKRIDRLLSTGGYQAITGQAGEGKTTLIAQLIANHFGREKTAYHFIPFNPGHDHQVTMLHSLMACLALKHQYLPDVWTHIFHRDTLAGIFANKLAEISAHGEQEVVFIDGLDQIRPEVSMGERDLYFLPPHLPRGIVIVVGTRPDDTLKPLKLLAPFDEYKLPRLSRGDFDLVLASYGLQLKEDVAGQLYEATQNNALYIDLVAKELARKGEITPEDIIKRVSHNPENIFSLSVDRLQQAKMVLAEAEVAAANARNDIDRAKALETLTLTLARGQLWEQARKVVQTSGVGWVKADTLSYLGSLLAEEQQWEQADAVWAEAEAEIGSVEGEEDKAEAFYELAILYIEAKQWERIEALLFKMERSWQRDYARLELGLALAEEQQWQRAEQLVRTIEDDQIKADALSQLGIVLRKARHQEQAGALLIEAEAIIRTVRENNENSNDVLRTQGEVLIRAQRWEEANALIRIMDESNERIWLLRDLSEAFVRTQQWERIGDVVQMIERSEKNGERTDALSRVAIALAELGQWERAEAVVRLMEASRERAKALLDLGTALAKAQQMERAKSLWVEVLNLVPAAEDYSERAEISQDLGMIFAKAQHGEQAQKFWAEAVRMASMIEDNQEKSYTLCKIGATLNAAQRREQAEAMWREAEAAAYALDMQEDRDQALWVLSITLSYAQQWEKAGPIAHAIAENAKRADALYTLSTALAYAEQDEKAEAILAEWLSVVNSLERDEAIYKIWKEVVRAGLWDRAKAMIDLMENTWRKERLRGELGEALAYEQQWEQAEAVIAEMEKGKQRVEALCVLGTALALAQQLERAESKWAEAEALADMIENGWEKESSLPHIGRALAQAHLWERAEAAANRLEESRDRANIMCEIQQALNYAGERERNLRLIQRSWQQAKTKEYLLKLLPLAYKFVIFSLTRLGRLDWFHRRPSSSRGEVKRSMLHRLLKPRCPGDCPACRLSSTPSLGGGPGPTPVRPWREVKSRLKTPSQQVAMVLTALAEGLDPSAAARVFGFRQATITSLSLARS